MAGHYMRLGVADTYDAVHNLVLFLVDVVGWTIAEDIIFDGDIRDVVLTSVGEPEVPNGFPRYIRLRNESAQIHLHTYETFVSTTVNTGELKDDVYGYLPGFTDNQGFEMMAVADLERVIITTYPYTGTGHYTGYAGRITSYYRANEHNYPNLIKGASTETITWYYSAAESNCFMLGPHGGKQHYYAVEPLNATGLTAGDSDDRVGKVSLAAPVLVNTDADVQRSELVGEPRGLYRISPEISHENAFVTINGEVYATSVQSNVHMVMGPIGVAVPSLMSAALTDGVNRYTRQAESHLLAHWDETTIQSVSGTVTAWVDKTGNGWDLVPGSIAPLHLVANQNGLDVVDCLTSNGYMDLDVSGGAPITGSDSGTFYMVLITDTAPGVSGRSPLDVTDGSDGPLHPFSSNQIFDDFGSTARRNFNQNPAGVVHTWHVYSGVSSTGDNRYDVNGVVQYSTTFNTVSWRPAGSSPWVVGGGSTGAFNGRIGELLIYGAAHGDGTRAHITQTLKAKWGII